MNKCLNKIVIRCNFVYHVVYIFIIAFHCTWDNINMSTFCVHEAIQFSCQMPLFQLSNSKKTKVLYLDVSNITSGALDKSKHVRFKESRVLIWTHMYPRSPAGLYTSPSCQLQRLFSLIGSVKCNTAL